MSVHAPVRAALAPPAPLEPPAAPAPPATLAPPAARTWLRAVRGHLAAAAGAAAAVGYVGAVDPNEAGHYPTCPFRWLTGLYCPGCGTLRAVHALAEGDLVTAVDRNVLTVLGGVLLVAIWARGLVQRWQGRPRPRPAPVWVLAAGAAVVLAFTVLRNLPIGAALAP